MAIDRYVCVTAYPREFGGRLRTLCDGVEDVEEVDRLRDRFARAVLRRAGVRGDTQVASLSDAPSGGGLGGSGAFTVALLHALRQARDAQPPDPVRLAEEASAVEMVDLGRPVGKHDHYMAALGGLRILRFAKDGGVQHTPLPVGDRL